MEGLDKYERFVPQCLSAVVSILEYFRAFGHYVKPASDHSYDLQLDVTCKISIRFQDITARLPEATWAIPQKHVMSIVTIAWSNGKAMVGLCYVRRVCTRNYQVFERP